MESTQESHTTRYKYRSANGDNSYHVIFSATQPYAQDTAFSTYIDNHLYVQNTRNIDTNSNEEDAPRTIIDTIRKVQQPTVLLCDTQRTVQRYRFDNGKEFLIHNVRMFLNSNGTEQTTAIAHHSKNH